MSLLRLPPWQIEVNTTLATLSPFELFPAHEQGGDRPTTNTKLLAFDWDPEDAGCSIDLELWRDDKPLDFSY